MAKTTPSLNSHWPAPPPFVGVPAAVWLDGTMASAAIAHALTQANRSWVALVDESRPARALEAAIATAGHLGVSVRLVDPEGPITAPVGWAMAAREAQAAEAPWLVLPVRQDTLEPPLALRLHAAETALLVHGLDGLWAPLLGWDAIAVARLALALGVPFEETWDCEAEAVCGACPGCVERQRAFKQLGMPDPVA